MQRRHREVDPYAAACIEAWNLMGGEIAWSGLAVVGELVGIADPERLVRGLVQIREWQRETADKG